jgi:hypothetical protein
VRLKGKERKRKRTAFFVYLGAKEGYACIFWRSGSVGLVEEYIVLIFAWTTKIRRQDHLDLDFSSPHSSYLSLDQKPFSLFVTSYS